MPTGHVSRKRRDRDEKKVSFAPSKRSKTSALVTPQTGGYNLRNRSVRAAEAAPFATPSSKRVRENAGGCDDDFVPEPESDEDIELGSESDGQIEDVQEDESAEVPTEVSTLAKPVLDPETGFYHVGKQALEAQQPVRTAPKHFVWLRLRRKATHSGAMPIDRTLEGHEASPAEFDHVMRTIFEQYKEQSTGWVAAPNDAYLGLEMFLSAGARNVSYEAIYPFVIAGRRLAYHANPLALVVTSEWMRTTFVYGDMGLAAQKARWRWCYNAMTNVRIMDIATGSHDDKKIRQTQWGEWSPEFTRAVLESLRTGVLSSEMREVIDTKERSRYSRMWART